jgi:hypothetical protein
MVSVSAVNFIYPKVNFSPILKPVVPLAFYYISCGVAQCYTQVKTSTVSVQGACDVSKRRGNGQRVQQSVLRLPLAW